MAEQVFHFEVKLKLEIHLPFFFSFFSFFSCSPENNNDNNNNNNIIIITHFALSNIF